MQQAIYEAMRARRSREVAALRTLLSALRSAAIDRRGRLSEADEIEVLQREAKRRREAEAAYRDAGRGDRAEQEAFELAIIDRFLPPRLDRAELEQLVDQALAATGAAGPRDLGKVMGALMPKVKGRADGAAVRELVQDRLSG